MNYRRLLFCLIALLSSGLNGFAAEVYAQLSSEKTQLPSAGSQIVTLESKDAISGMDYISPTKLGVKEAGVYYIIVSTQAGADQSIEAAGAYVDIWLIRNGKPIPNSGSTMYVYFKQSTMTLVSQVIMPLSAGDTLSVGFSSTKPSIGLIATDAPAGESTICSAQFSVFKITSFPSVAKK